MTGHWKVEPHPENGTYKVVDSDTGTYLRKSFFADSAAQTYAQLQNERVARTQI